MSLCDCPGRVIQCQLSSMAYLVLDLGVAPRWGHILRHGGGIWGVWRLRECSEESLDGEVGDAGHVRYTVMRATAAVIGRCGRWAFFPAMYKTQ